MPQADSRAAVLTSPSTGVAHSHSLRSNAAAAAQRALAGSNRCPPSSRSLAPQPQQPSARLASKLA
eukprot:1260909-Pleurochrysis_carterae.AAC.1